MTRLNRRTAGALVVAVALETEPDKNTYLRISGQRGADPHYDYGTHFLFQGHEHGAPGNITRINLDADADHRVTLIQHEWHNAVQRERRGEGCKRDALQAPRERRVPTRDQLPRVEVTAVEDAGDGLHTDRNALDSGYVFDTRKSYAGGAQPVRWLGEGRDASATIDSGLSATSGFNNEGDDEITCIHVSDGDPTPSGVLGARVPNAFSGA
jgi:hypothetical protein